MTTVASPEAPTEEVGGDTIRTNTKNIQSVEIEHLRIDPAYQRDYKSKRAEAIGRSWNDDQAQVITVSKRDDGKLYVIDGQHRTHGARIAGKSHLDAEVHEGLTVEQEAELFDRLNTGRSFVNALERFRARLVYGEPEATEINKIVQEFGGAVAEKIGRKNSNDMSVRSIAALERIYNAGGPDLLREILALIRDAWGGIDYITTNEYTLGGLRQLMVKQPKLNRDRLVERLGTTGHAQIRRMAHANGQIFGGSGPMNFYRACVEAYNKNLSPRSRLKP